MKHVIWIVMVAVVSLFILVSISSAENLFANDPVAINNAAKSVLKLEVYDAYNRLFATGSGFISFDNRSLVTNYHVIDGGSKVVAITDDEEKYLIKTVLCSNKAFDIAILYFEDETKLNPLPLYYGNTIMRGDSIVAIGSPIGIKNTVSIGNISATYEENGVPYLQFTAPISHGSSGGALFDGSGRVIGITSATYRETQNLNLAISASVAQAMYNSWNGNKYELGNAPISSVIDFSLLGSSESMEISIADNTRWICTKCNNENTTKFCQLCGSPRQEWMCKCGQINLGKFCGSCGASVERLVTAFNAAIVELQNGCFAEALQSFADLGKFNSMGVETNAGNMQKAAEHISQVHYQWALQLLTESKYNEAITHLEQCSSNQSDVRDVLLKAYYCYAEQLMEACEYDQASQFFTMASGYKDADERILEPYYMQGMVALESGEYESAISSLQMAAGFAGAGSLVEEARYGLGCKLMLEGDYEGAISQFNLLGAYKDAVELRKECVYQNAEIYALAGDYQKAITLLRGIMLYKDSKEKIQVYHYDAGIQAMTNGEWDTAYQHFNSIPEYKDAEQKAYQANCENVYSQAMQSYQTGRWSEASEVFLSLGDFKDSQEKIALCEQAIVNRRNSCKVGECITFGAYMQTADGDDLSPIEWLVIARDGKKVLLISQKILDMVPYNLKNEDTSWEKCSLRQWLNSSFIKIAFTETEQKAILKVNVENGKNQGGPDGIKGGNKTEDKVYLLSYAEVQKYLKKQENKISIVTDYVKTQKMGPSWKTNPCWILRTMFMTPTWVSLVSDDGEIGSSFQDVDSANVGIRPVLWIDLNCKEF